MTNGQRHKLTKSQTNDINLMHFYKNGNPNRGALRNLDSLDFYMEMKDKIQ